MYYLYLLIILVEKCLELIKLKYYIKTCEDKKIGIFTDLHLGVQKDSQIRLDETIKCIDWIID